jgi:hypothetical protein
MRQESSPTLQNSCALQFTLTKNGGSILEHDIEKPIIINSKLITINPLDLTDTQKIELENEILLFNLFIGQDP